MRQRHTVRRAHTAATGRTDAGAPTPATEPHAATMRSQFMALRRPPLGITQYAVTARIRPKHTKCFCTRRDKTKTITRKKRRTRTTNVGFVAFVGTFARPGARPGLHLGCPPSLHPSASTRGALAALRLDRSAGSCPARAAVRRRRRRCCQCGRKPAASARRLQGQSQRQIRSSAAQPPPRGIQAESGFPPDVPALRTSSVLGPAPFRRIPVSRSSSPSTGPNSRPCVSTTLARVLRRSASSTRLRSIRPRSRHPLFALR